MSIEPNQFLPKQEELLKKPCPPCSSKAGRFFAQIIEGGYAEAMKQKMGCSAYCQATLGKTAETFEQCVLNCEEDLRQIRFSRMP